MFGLTDKWISLSNIGMLKTTQGCIGIGKIKNLEGDSLDFIFPRPLRKLNRA